MKGPQQKRFIVWIFPSKWSPSPASPRLLSSLIWQRGCGALSSLHLFLTSQAGQLLLSSPAPPPTAPPAPHPAAPHQICLPSGLARERPPSTTPQSMGLASPLCSPKHPPCLSQAPVGLHFLISKTLNLLVTPLRPDFFPILSSPPHLPPALGGNKASAAPAGTKAGHAVAETETHPYSMFGATVCTTPAPSGQKRAHSLPPNTNGGTHQVTGGVLHGLLVQRPRHL